MNEILDRVIALLDTIAEFGGRVYHGAQTAISAYPACMVLPRLRSKEWVVMGEQKERTYRITIIGYIEREDTVANSKLIVTLGEAAQEKLDTDPTLGGYVYDQSLGDLSWDETSKGEVMLRMFSFDAEYKKKFQ